MLQFAAPLGLLALGAVLAPVLIHLVRRPLRVVRVGNLQFLQSQRRPVRSLRWQQWLLLALRSSVLAALALSLAGVQWLPGTREPVRWLLLAPGAELDAPAHSEWGRLRAEGFEPRLLASGFPLLDAPASPHHADADAWSLLREADQRLPAGSRIDVFGPTWATQFRGVRPTLSHVQVRWRRTPAAARGTVVPAPARVALIAAPDREADARYLRSALASFGGVLVADETPAWIFQLGDVTLPAAWSEQVRRGARLVTDAPGSARPVEVNRWLSVGEERIPLRRRVLLDAGVPRERDSAGEPWITESRLGAGRHWRFALRFHPDWSDWPLGSAFPAWWREQLMPRDDSALTIAPEQAAPHFSPVTAGASAPPAATVPVDLRGWSWLLAVMLYAFERALSGSPSHRRNRI